MKNIVSLLVIKSDKILTVRNNNIYSLPNSVINDNQDPELAAKEIKEKFGIDIEIIQKFSEHQFTSGNEQYHHYVFEAKINNDLGQRNDINFVPINLLNSLNTTEDLRLVSEEITR